MTSDLHWKFIVVVYSRLTGILHQKEDMQNFIMTRLNVLSGLVFSFPLPWPCT